MAQIPINEALNRFKDNEERLDKFVNDKTGYTTSSQVRVESIPAFLNRVENKILQTTGAISENVNAAKNAANEAKAARDAANEGSSKLTTARNIALTGAVTGNVNFDGSADVSIKTWLNLEDFANSKAENGYLKLPNGLILQWVRINKWIGSSGGTYNFPIAFPYWCFGVLCGNPFNGGAHGFTASAGVISNATFQVTENRFASVGVGNPCQLFVIAIGH